MRRSWLVVGALGAALLAGCADGVPTAPDRVSRVEVDTPELRAAKQQAGVEDCVPGTGSSRLPAISLQCLGGGPAVDLSAIPGPAVLQVWASWCVSCPDELPLFQRLRDEAGERLTVLGVDYQDQFPGKALAILDEVGATMPQLADPGGVLADHYRIRGLPGILLVDGTGDVTFLARRIDTYPELLGVVAEHTGVRVGAQ